jgi:hypothetical protein
VLGEPSPNLFQVPQGYEVTTLETPRPGLHVVPGTTGPRFQLRGTEPAVQE